MDIKQLIKKEYAKCAADPVYFFRTYCYIQHPNRGKILFNLYDFQEDLLQGFADERYNIILKSRQLGISTLTAGYSLWMMLFHSDKNILVIATKQETAKNLVTKVRYMHENLPSWLRRKTEENNKLLIRFTNGSQIKAATASPEASRSEALSLLVIDEAAFVEKIDEIWGSAYSTLSTGGKSIVLSTPNGTGNFFHKKWVGEEDDQIEWNRTKLHWTVHPERDQAWRDEQTRALGEKMAAQECDCDFISSGNTVVDGFIREWYKNNLVEEPMEKRGMQQAYWVWRAVDYSRDYMVVADVARGDGSDYSTFQVMDVESMEQVAEFKAKVDTKAFGRILVSVATEWNDALLVIENATIGWAVIQEVIDRGYPNLFYSYKSINYVDEDIHLAKGYDLKNKSDMVPGFTMGVKNRPLVIDKLDVLMSKKIPIIRSSRLMNELDVFIWHNGKGVAQRGYNDDLVMAFGVALWIRDTALKLRREGIEMNKRLIGMTRKISSFPVKTSGFQQPSYRNQWNMDLGNGQSEDLTKWLK